MLVCCAVSKKLNTWPKCVFTAQPMEQQATNKRTKYLLTFILLVVAQISLPHDYSNSMALTNLK